MIQKILLLLFSLFTSCSVLLLGEFVCMHMNRSNDVSIPFLYNHPPNKNLKGTKYHAIDSLLGYAPSMEDLTRHEYTVPILAVPGFVIYFPGYASEHFDFDKLERPLIVTLGGSTTEPARGISWPEHLAVLLKKSGISGTVINGGVGGYSSNQELLKLIRDVTDYKPDFLITYHGVNEVGWVRMPYPMTSIYAQDLFHSLVDNSSPTYGIFPNIRYLAASKNITNQNADALSVTFGVPSNNSHATNFIKNIKLIDAIAKAYGIKHSSFLQPYAYTGRYAEHLAQNYPEFITFMQDRAASYGLDEDVSKEMYQALHQIMKNSSIALTDFTAIFDDIETNVYLDKHHLTNTGNNIVANEILRELNARYLEFR